MAKLTGITHSKAYGDGQCHCAGWLEADEFIFVHCWGPFGNLPDYFSVERARALSVVLSGIGAEHDEYQAGLAAEYGPLSE